MNQIDASQKPQDFQSRLHFGQNLRMCSGPTIVKKWNETWLSNDRQNDQKSWELSPNYDEKILLRFARSGLGSGAAEILIYWAIEMRSVEWSSGYLNFPPLVRFNFDDTFIKFWAKMWHRFSNFPNYYNYNDDSNYFLFQNNFKLKNNSYRLK